MSHIFIPSSREPLVDVMTGRPSRPFTSFLDELHWRICRGDAEGASIRWGTGSPEGVVTSPVGGVYLRTDGGASTVLYIKESGTGNTGWRAV